MLPGNPEDSAWLHQDSMLCGGQDAGCDRSRCETPPFFEDVPDVLLKAQLSQSLEIGHL